MHLLALFFLLSSSPLILDGGKSSSPSIKSSEEVQSTVKLEERDSSEPNDSKEKAGPIHSSDQPCGEKYSPKVSISSHHHPIPGPTLQLCLDIVITVTFGTSFLCWAPVPLSEKWAGWCGGEGNWI